VNIELRLYEELNDFLPDMWQKRSVTSEFPEGTTVGEVLAKLGVPLSEVELVLVDGQSVDFDHRLSDGVRMAVYPRFELFDVTPLLRVREQPLRQTAFVAGRDLRILSEWLVRLGFDLLFCPDATNDELIAIQASEKRILLTTDPDLLRRPNITRACLIQQNHPGEQLNALLDNLNVR
jgi:sulfur carrier protein ThiS